MSASTQRSPSRPDFFVDIETKLDHYSVETVGQVVVDKTGAMDEALGSLATAIFNASHNLLESSPLFSHREEEL